MGNNLDISIIKEDFFKIHHLINCMNQKAKTKEEIKNYYDQIYGQLRKTTKKMNKLRKNI
jgi:geranylgeranyl pyrophosphate synthase